MGRLARGQPYLFLLPELHSIELPCRQNKEMVGACTIHQSGKAGLCNQMWAQASALLLPSCWTLGKSFDLSEPQFLLL